VGLRDYSAVVGRALILSSRKPREYSGDRIPSSIPQKNGANGWFAELKMQKAENQI
jgi:hypothetical protein